MTKSWSGFDYISKLDKNVANLASKIEEFTNSKEWLGYETAKEIDKKVLNLNNKVQNLESQFNSVCTLAAIIIIIRFIRRLILKCIDLSN